MPGSCFACARGSGRARSATDEPSPRVRFTSRRHAGSALVTLIRPRRSRDHRQLDAVARLRANLLRRLDGVDQLRDEEVALFDREVGGRALEAIVEGAALVPGRDGLDVLRAIRATDVKTLVFVLTARDTLDDRVLGLDAGADDYLVKPFAFAELLARVRALSRRGQRTDVTHLTVGPLTMDRRSREVMRGERSIELTTRECALLECLMRNQGQVVSRETLAREVWSETARSVSLDNVIDVHVARLRRKVDADQPAPLIHTVRGVGFLLGDREP